MKLARLGTGFVAPNPMVGCVIVHEDNIIGEGYHEKYGNAHAEVNAIHSVTKKHLLSSSILFVNLEPCAHQGKTPPCTERIIAAGIPQVMIGSLDPNPLVAGKGIESLRAAGCNVTQGLLEAECDELNKFYMTYHKRHRPYVVLKWAQTSDGFIDVNRSSHALNRPTWITGDFEQTLVHKWRAEIGAVMIGTNTALLDNPMLNLRRWKGLDPLRVVIDRTGRLPASLHLFEGNQPTLVFVEKPSPQRLTAEHAVVPFDDQLPHRILDELYRRKITSLMIEGGAELLRTFIRSGLWDEARIFTGYQHFEEGVAAPEAKGRTIRRDSLKTSRLLINVNDSPAY
jgi:diaminohydroxyphosphoribosylaminopyrimidine deaminase/5-amino-6-(5-phosphoribosylamino)uracil reductase